MKFGYKLQFIILKSAIMPFLNYFHSFQKISRKSVKFRAEVATIGQRDVIIESIPLIACPDP
jgi:hypothetical protein